MPDDPSDSETTGDTPEEAAPGGTAASPETPPADEATPFEFTEFDAVSEVEHSEAMSLLADVSLDVTIELGRTRMTIDDVLRLADGAVVELDKLAGDPLDIYVNERLVARGEVLVLNDTFSVRVSEILDAGAIEEAGRAQRAEPESSG
ncbi:MAG: flagellar motor switch protein FliN [Planctomycetota bacterium]